MTRKEFLILISALMWGPKLVGQSVGGAREVLVLGDGERGAEDMFSIQSTLPGAAIVNFGNNCFTLKLPFRPHSFIPTENRDLLLATEKWGRHYALINWREKSVKFVKQLASGRRFFGHGCADGARTYLTVMNDKENRGEIAVLNSVMEIERCFPSGGSYPHDIQYDSSIDKVIVMNSRGHTAKTTLQKYGKHQSQEDQSSLTWLDTVTGKISKRIQLKNASGGYSHFLRSAENVFYICGSEYDGGAIARPLVARINRDESISPFRFPERIKGEALSLAISSEGCLAATLPAANQIHFWKISDGKHVRKMNLGEPRGVSWSKQRGSFLISSAQERNFYRVKEFGSEVSRETHLLAGRGSHLLLFSDQS